MPDRKKPKAGFAERPSPYDANTLERIDLQLGPGGRIVIPAAFRNAMQVKEGDRIMARVVDGELRLITPEMGIKLAQKIVRDTIPGTDSLVESLLEDRRREVEDELREE